jgi:hypothetical protein
VVMGAFHRWRSWESDAHGHAYLISKGSQNGTLIEEILK